MSDVTMRQMLEAGVHFGHQTRYWSPKMRPYIFGERNKIHIINLEHSLPMFNEALNFLGNVSANGGTILIVGTKRAASKLVKAAGEEAGVPYVNHRWLGGMLTNYNTVKNSIRRLKDLEARATDGSNDRLSKKESLTLERERAKLERSLGGIKDMGGLPDVLFVIDVKQEYIAVSEANKLGIPVVAVVDTNCLPDGVDYVIPGNDDAIRSIRLYLEQVTEAIMDARQSAQIQIAGDADDYIEVDASGHVVDSVATKVVVPRKGDRVTPAEAGAESVVHTDASEAEAPAVAGEGDTALPDSQVAAEPTEPAEKQEHAEAAEPEPAETPAPAEAVDDPAESEAETDKEAASPVEESPADEAVADDATPEDDLTEINGIGPVIKGKLYGQGITSFRQIAELTAEDIERVDAELNFKGRMGREEWVSQAKKLV